MEGVDGEGKWFSQKAFLVARRMQGLKGVTIPTDEEDEKEKQGEEGRGRGAWYLRATQQSFLGSQQTRRMKKRNRGMGSHPVVF